MNTKHSTTRRRRSNQYTGKLKVLLFTGSVMATVAGMKVLPMQDGIAAEAPVSSVEPIIVVVPNEVESSFQLPPGDRHTRIELNPIPKVVQPDLKPVARTRSS